MLLPFLGTCFCKWTAKLARSIIGIMFALVLIKKFLLNLVHQTLSSFSSEEYQQHCLRGTELMNIYRTCQAACFNHFFDFSRVCWLTDRFLGHNVEGLKTRRRVAIASTPAPKTLKKNTRSEGSDHVSEKRQSRPTSPAEHSTTSLGQRNMTCTSTHFYPRKRMVHFQLSKS